MNAWSDQRGFTLVELLMSMVVFVLVLGATLSIFEGALKNIGRDTERAHATEEPLAGIARIVRDLRGAEEVLDMTGNAVDVITPSSGQLLRVRYDCDVAAPNDPNNAYDNTYRRCVRRTAVAVPNADPPALPALSTGETVIDRICPGTSTTVCDSAAAAPVFTCRADDGTVAACAQLPPLPIDPDDLPEPDDDPPAPLYPTNVAVRILVPARGESKSNKFTSKVAYTDGAYMRNIAQDAQGDTG